MSTVEMKDEGGNSYAAKPLSVRDMAIIGLSLSYLGRQLDEGAPLPNEILTEDHRKPLAERATALSLELMQTLLAKLPPEGIEAIAQTLNAHYGNGQTRQ